MDAGVEVAPLRSRKYQRSLSLQKVQHAAPAAALLLQGFATLQSKPHGFELGLATIGIVAGGVMLMTLARALRAGRVKRRSQSNVSHGHGIDWVDVAVAGVLAVEALERWHVKHHVARPTILLAIVMLALGLSHGRLAARRGRRRVLRLDEKEMFVGGGLFRRFHARWDQIAAIEIGDRWATVRTRSGRERRIDLEDMENADEIRRLLDTARGRLIAAP